ncbi:unnamed protein product [Cuscuta epithymum]|uniref:Uncharacterized protein n=1 Tax=Cuscuta epithymum TaxID=186058 RepID=A0AAV0G658_9ASTE|nr:unnamed protein product [Cuscuta epithymum]
MRPTSPASFLLPLSSFLFSSSFPLFFFFPLFISLSLSFFFSFPVCSHFFCRSKSGQKNRRSHNLNLLCSLKYNS